MRCLPKRRILYCLTVCVLIISIISVSFPIFVFADAEPSIGSKDNLISKASFFNPWGNSSYESSDQKVVLNQEESANPQALVSFENIGFSSDNSYYVGATVAFDSGLDFGDNSGNYVRFILGKNTDGTVLVLTFRPCYNQIVLAYTQKGAQSDKRPENGSLNGTFACHDIDTVRGFNTTSLSKSSDGKYKVTIAYDASNSMVKAWINGQLAINGDNQSWLENDMTPIFAIHSYGTISNKCLSTISELELWNDSDDEGFPMIGNAENLADSMSVSISGGEQYNYSDQKSIILSNNNVNDSKNAVLSGFEFGNSNEYVIKAQVKVTEDTTTWGRVSFVIGKTDSGYVEVMTRPTCGTGQVLISNGNLGCEDWVDTSGSCEGLNTLGKKYTYTLSYSKGMMSFWINDTVIYHNYDLSSVIKTPYIGFYALHLSAEISDVEIFGDLHAVSDEPMLLDSYNAISDSRVYLNGNTFAYNAVDGLSFDNKNGVDCAKLNGIEYKDTNYFVIKGTVNYKTFYNTYSSAVGFVVASDGTKMLRILARNCAGNTQVLVSCSKDLNEDSFYDPIGTGGPFPYDGVPVETGIDLQYTVKYNAGIVDFWLCGNHVIDSLNVSSQFSGNLYPNAMIYAKMCKATVKNVELFGDVNKGGVPVLEEGQYNAAADEHFEVEFSKQNSSYENGKITLNLHDKNNGTWDAAWLSGFCFDSSNSFVIKAVVDLKESFTDQTNSRFGIITAGTDKFSKLIEASVRPESGDQIPGSPTSNGQSGIIYGGINVDFAKGCTDAGSISVLKYDTSCTIGSTKIFTLKYNNGKLNMWLDDNLLWDNYDLSLLGDLQPTVALFAYNCEAVFSDIQIFGGVTPISNLPVIGSQENIAEFSRISVSGGAMQESKKTGISFANTGDAEFIDLDFDKVGDFYVSGEVNFEQPLSGDNSCRIGFVLAESKKADEFLEFGFLPTDSKAVALSCSGKSTNKIIQEKAINLLLSKSHVFTARFHNKAIDFWIDEELVFEGISVEEYVGKDVKLCVKLNGVQCASSVKDIKIWGDVESCLVSTDAEFDASNIVVKAGVISDPHLTYSYYDENQVTTSIQRYTDALAALKSASNGQLDVIMNLGDYTSNGSKEQASTFVSATKTALSGIFGNDTPEVCLVYGNHDTNWGGCMTAEQWDKYLRENGLRKTDFEAGCPSGCYHLKVKKNGVTYHFLSVETQQYFADSITNVFSSEVLSWLDYTLNEITSADSKHYIYVGTHAPVQEAGNYGADPNLEPSADWATAKGNKKGYNGDINGVLEKYPQVVLFNGHTHFAEYLDTSIMQKAYTAISVSSCTSHDRFSNSYSKYLEQSTSGEPYYEGMGILVEVDCNGNQRISRLDFGDSNIETSNKVSTKQVKNPSYGQSGEPEKIVTATLESCVVSKEGSVAHIGDDWVMPAPNGNDKMHLTYYSGARGRVVSSPVISEASVNVSDVMHYENLGIKAILSFDAAVSDTIVMQYRISAYDAFGNSLAMNYGIYSTDGGIVSSDKTSEEVWTVGNWSKSQVGCYGSKHHQNASRYQYSIILPNAHASGVYFEITPVDQYGNLGNTVTSVLAVPENIKVPEIKDNVNIINDTVPSKNGISIKGFSSKDGFDIAGNSGSVAAVKFGNAESISTGNYVFQMTVKYNHFYKELGGFGIVGFYGRSKASGEDRYLEFSIRRIQDNQYQLVVFLRNYDMGEELLAYSYANIVDMKIGEDYIYSLEYKSNGKLAFWIDDIVVWDDIVVSNYLDNAIPAFGLNLQSCSVNVKDLKLWGNVKAGKHEPDGSGYENIADKMTILSDEGYVDSSTRSFEYNGNSNKRYDYSEVKYQNNSYVYSANVFYNANKTILQNGTEVNWEGVRFTIAKAKYKGREYYIQLSMRGDINQMGVFAMDCETFEELASPMTWSYYETVPENEYRCTIAFDNGVISFWRDGSLLIDGYDLSNNCNYCFTDIKAQTGFYFEMCGGKVSDIKIYGQNIYITKKAPVLVNDIPKFSSDQYNAAQFMRVFKNGIRDYLYNDFTVKNSDYIHTNRYVFENIPFETGIDAYVFRADVTVDVREKEWHSPRLLFRTAGINSYYVALFENQILLLKNSDRVLASINYDVQLGKAYDVAILSTANFVTVWIDGEVIFRYDLSEEQSGKPIATPGVLFENCAGSLKNIKIYGKTIEFDKEVVPEDLYNNQYYMMNGIPAKPTGSINYFENSILAGAFANIGGEYKNGVFRNTVTDQSASICFLDQKGNYNLNGLSNSTEFVFHYRLKVDSLGENESAISCVFRKNMHPSNSTAYQTQFTVYEDRLALQSYENDKQLICAETPFSLICGKEYDITILTGKSWAKIWIDGELLFVVPELPHYDVYIGYGIFSAAVSMDDFELYDCKQSDATLLPISPRNIAVMAGNTISTVNSIGSPVSKKGMIVGIASVFCTIVSVAALLTPYLKKKIKPHLEQK